MMVRLCFFIFLSINCYFSLITRKVLLGKTIRLRCRALDYFYNIQQARVIWEVQTEHPDWRGILLERNMNGSVVEGRVILLKGGDLLVRAVQRNFQGMYSCRVSGFRRLNGGFGDSLGTVDNSTTVCSNFNNSGCLMTQYNLSKYYCYFK